MVQRQCANLVGMSLPQALEMVSWSYCGVAVAELVEVLSAPPAPGPPGILPQCYPVARPAECYRTPSRPY